MSQLDIQFEGFWQCRLATDPDPSDEQRGISGFTYSISGETLLEPSFWSQEKDIENEYGKKKRDFIDPLAKNKGNKVMNIREASPDYKKYNENGIGIKVSQVLLDGEPYEAMSDWIGGLVRFKKREEQPDWPWKGPIFEGRNQITSDGDPDRFTLNPFVFTVSDPNDKLMVSRFDPLDFNDPDKPLWKINPKDKDFNKILERRLPKQRFAMSMELLAQVGISSDDLNDHFTNRANWLKSKIMEAEANNQKALAEAFKSRLFAVDFFTQSTGPTVLENRLLSRVPLRQLYHHSLRGTKSMKPVPFLDSSRFTGLNVDMKKEWDLLYYLGAYDGDLMSGWCTGTLSLPVSRV